MSITYSNLTVQLFVTLGPFADCHETVDPQPYFSDCVYDLCATLPDESPLCPDISVYADQCRANLVDIGLWRTRQFCPMECPEGSHYNPCMTACPATCADLDGPNDCLQPCVGGCECDEGWVLSDTRCVQLEECGCYSDDRYFMPGDEFVTRDCSHRCICNHGNSIDCDAITCHNNAECIYDAGIYDCMCMDGFYGDGYVGQSGCLPEPCAQSNPCVRGDCIPLAGGEYKCVCPVGWTGELCNIGQTKCSAHGDPHYTTFDGYSYDYMGHCQYVLAETCHIQDGDGVAAFRIVQQNQPYPFNPWATTTKELYISLLGYDIEFLQGKVVRVGVVGRTPVTVMPPNTVLHYPGFSIFNGPRVHLMTDFGLEVLWDGVYDVDVYISDVYEDRMCGLCGDNGNDGPADDRVKPDMTEASSDAEFGDSWIVNPNDCTSGVDPPDGYNPCADLSADDQNEINDLCGIITDDAGPFRECHDGVDANVDPTEFFDNCQYDLCATWPSKAALCTDIEAYDLACREADVNTYEWRTDNLCAPSCPFGSVYKHCTAQCPDHCLAHLYEDADLELPPVTPEELAHMRSTCLEHCVPGCECVDGRIWSSDRCVPAEECGCVDMDGTYIPLGDSVIREGCNEICTCEETAGDLECMPLDCHCEAECDVHDGIYGCACPPPFVGDGFVCSIDPCFYEPCNTGECHANDDRLTYTCICPRGLTGHNCEIAGGICSAYGDPHYLTFDGAPYDFQGHCWYILAATCNGANVDHPFEIFVNNDAPPNNAMVSSTREVHIHLINEDITISMLRGKVLQIDGVNTGTPVQILPGVGVTSGNELIFHSYFGLTVRWNGASNVDVIVDEQYLGIMCGLCGNFDQQVTDDNTATSTPSDYGNSHIWADNPDGCVAQAVDDGYDPCAQSGQLATMADELCAVLTDQAGPFSACIAAYGALSDIQYATCRFDVCATENTICENYEQFERHCKDSGIAVGQWRTTALCPITCPDGFEYSPCVSPCPRTCANVREGSPQFPCLFQCIEGCQCPAGWLLSNQLCVREEECGCFYEGHYFELGEEFITPDCTKSCVCLINGEVRCNEENGCDINAACDVIDGVLGCRCNENYVGDGFTCMGNPCGDEPCNNGGVCHHTTDLEYICTCPLGFTGQNCDIALHVCTAWGDPHYISFDGTMFDFMGPCEYILAQRCNVAGDTPPDFTVIQRNEPYGRNPLTSVTKEVEVMFEGSIVTMLRDLVVYVDGVQENPTISLKHGNGIEIATIRQSAGSLKSKSTEIPFLRNSYYEVV
ncbi:IgGFc-binding protein-like [Amphiura filiformis]|uniref:IgGFc-binding protein-like n=1 Tax=Amphiura filiformis TaxID=82378 RepID=UPI003B2219C2